MMQHLIEVGQLDRNMIELILKRAEQYAEGGLSQVRPLQGKWISTLFYEPSTRTRCSFEVAARRLGAEVLSFDVDHSSTLKGETLYDTLRTLEALGMDGVIVRQGSTGLLQKLGTHFSIPLLNAGDGTGEHPSQALLDLYTIWKEFGQLQGLKVLIAGDILHSRVAHSDLSLFRKMGIEVMVSGPPSFVNPISRSNPQLNKIPVVDLDQALGQVDVVMMLRIQNERHDQLQLDQTAYHQQYGLTEARYERLQEHAILMHPGPVNRDVELASILVEADKSRIFTQMKNGLFVRMAILEYLLGGIQDVHLTETSQSASA